MVQFVFLPTLMADQTTAEGNRSVPLFILILHIISSVASTLVRVWFFQLGNGFVATAAGFLALFSIGFWLTVGSKGSKIHTCSGTTR